MTSFMDILIEQPFHIIIGEYIGLNDNRNLISLNKEIYNNKISKTYFKKIVIEKSKKIIFNFMKKIVNHMKYVNKAYEDEIITRKNIALYYFKNYDKEYIKEWYNINIVWKKRILDKYKKNDDIKENPSRYDLFKLIRKMDINHTYSIGW